MQGQVALQGGRILPVLIVGGEDFGKTFFRLLLVRVRNDTIGVDVDHPVGIDDDLLLRGAQGIIADRQPQFLGLGLGQSATNVLEDDLADRLLKPSSSAILAPISPCSMP
jgi:hypothetical protein